MEKYLNKLKKTKDKINKMVNELEGSVYDFSNVLINDKDLLKLDLEIDKLESEKIRQQNIERQVKLLVKDVVDRCYDSFVKSSSYDGCLEHEYYYYHFYKKFRIKAYNNYYHVWFDGNINENFVFDKGGNLIFRGSHFVELDDTNFIGLKYDREHFDDKAYHYEVKNGSCELVKILNDVNNVEDNKYFNDDLVVFVTSDEYMLYNYQNKEIVIPSFSTVYEEESPIKGVEPFLYVEKKIVMTDDFSPVEVTKLGYNVEKSGFLEYPPVVFDLYDCDKFYLLNNRGSSQEEALNSIYNEVKNEYKKLMKNVKKKTKVKN